MFKRMKHSTKILPTLVATGTMLTSPVMAQGDEQRGFLESRAKEIKTAQEAPKSSLEGTLSNSNGDCKDYVETHVDSYKIVNINDPKGTNSLVLSVPRCLEGATNPDGSIQRASDRINKSFKENGISLNAIQNFNDFVDFSTKGIYTYDEDQTFVIHYSGPIPEANVTTPAQSGVEATAKTKSDVDEVIVLSGGKDSQGLVVGDQRDYMILPISGERGAKVTLQDDGNYLIQPIKGMGGIDENGRLDYSFHSNTETFNRKELDFTIAYRIFHAEADTLANSRAMGEKEYNHLQNLEVRLCSDKIKGGCFDIEQAAQIGANIAVSLGASIQVKNGTYVPSDNFEKGYFTEAAKTNWGYGMPAKVFEALSDGDGYYSTETQKALAKDVEEKCFGLEDVTFNEVANCGYNATINFGGKN